jgi:hypothetical protein
MMKRRCKMIKNNNKYNFTKDEQKLYDRLITLSKTTKVRPKLINSKDSYQFIGNHYKENEDER